MKELYDFLAEIDALDTDGQRELDALIAKTSDLKQLPVIARKIMNVVENPNSTAGDLERLIQADQSLTVKLLKIANSSFYGLLRKVNTLQRAILVVGFKSIRDIAVSAAILNMYRSSDPFSLKMWEHAICSGIAARYLALECENVDTDEAFVGGLLHDLGQVLLFRAYPDKIKEIYSSVQKDPTLDELKLEKASFNFCHTHAGGTLARNWNLSPALEAVMRYHHHLPEILWTDISDDVKMLVAITAYSDRICRYLGIGFNEPNANLEMVVCPENELLKISKERVGELIKEVQMSFFTESMLFA